ncbi:acyl-CoA dehydrogenase family protein [Streptomyces sp. NPDC093225]|uniref:acyl-CoA dehydrogenase family protein n=1 Tax=Streptomyces sp. NPDC093225 TaxID=3366034 RepID=UPI0038291192
MFPHSPDSGRPSPAEAARELADRVARPTAADRDREGRWDARLFADLAAATAGGRAVVAGAAVGGGPAAGAGPDAPAVVPPPAGALVPASLGGAGLSASETCALLHGLGEGARDPGLALALGVHAVLATVPLRAFGSPEQRERYLPRMASGEWLGGLSLRQTQGTSLAPAVTAWPAPHARDGWLLSGTLDLVALGPRAHHFLVLAAHQDGRRTAFVLDRATPGLHVEADAPAAMPTCPWGRLVLTDCLAPSAAVLGTPGGAAAEVEPLLAALDWVFTSAPWLGVMRALTRDAVDTARERELFGRPLAHAQSARFTLADLATRCELAEGLLYRAAAQFDAGGRPSPQDAAAARLFVAAAARTVAEGAARLAGPLADDGDRLIERAHRDALFFAGTGGGTEVLRPVIAASLLGLG